VLPDISLERAETTAAQIRERGGQSTALQVDISEESSTLAVLAQVKALHGRVEILLNNAALSYGITPRPWDTWMVESGTRSSPSTPGAPGSCARPSHR
jgi:NAD(P)-dependent dehydrogenase (short-subunit alcohol dehydrogenase family)